MIECFDSQHRRPSIDGSKTRFAEVGCECPMPNRSDQLLAWPRMALSVDTGTSIAVPRTAAIGAQRALAILISDEIPSAVFGRSTDRTRLNGESEAAEMASLAPRRHERDIGAQFHPSSWQ
jgi:hypothetical protein